MAATKPLAEINQFKSTRRINGRVPQEEVSSQFNSSSSKSAVVRLLACWLVGWLVGFGETSCETYNGLHCTHPGHEMRSRRFIKEAISWIFQFAFIIPVPGHSLTQRWLVWSSSSFTRLFYHAMRLNTWMVELRIASWGTTFKLGLIVIEYAHAELRGWWIRWIYYYIIHSEAA